MKPYFLAFVLVLLSGYTYALTDLGCICLDMSGTTLLNCGNPIAFSGMGSSFTISEEVGDTEDITDFISKTSESALGAIIEIDETAIPSGLAQVFQFTLNSNGSSEVVQFRIADGTGNCLAVPAGPAAAVCNSCGGRPYDIVLVLDRSGSMQGDSWTNLTSAVQEFMVTYANTLPDINGHELSIVYFNGSSAITDFSDDLELSPGLTGVNLNTDAFYGPIFSGIQGQSPTGCTPMGAGLARAINNELDNSGDKKRVVFLFTDGMQNVLPAVNATISTANISDTAPPAFYSCNPGSTLGSTINLLNQNIELFVVGTGATDVNLLGDLASSVTGESNAYIYVPSTTNLADAFDALATISAATESPQRVAYRTGSGGNIHETFLVNQGVNNLVLNLRVKNVSISGKSINLKELRRRISNGIQEAPIWLEKNGTVVRSNIGRFLMYGDDFATLKIEFPGFTDDQDNPISPEGEWAFRFNNTFPGLAFDYEFVAKVDEKRLDYHVSLDDVGNTFAVGDDIPVNVRIGTFGQLLDTDVQVEVTMLRPGEDVGDLMANTNTDISTNPIEQGLSSGQAKRTALFEDADFLNALQPVGVNIPMTKQSDGIWQGAFSNAQMTGYHKAVIRIKGTHPLVGDFERITFAGAAVDFGAADIDASFSYVQPGIVVGNSVTSTLWLQPKNVAEKLLGPDSPHRIRVLTSDGSVGDIYDNLVLGYYGIPITHPVNVDPTVTVFVADQTTPLYQQPLSVFAEENKAPPTEIEENTPPRFTLPPIGATFPLSTFNDSYDQGLAIQGKILFRSSKPLQINLEGAFYTFSGTNNTIANLNIFGIAVGPRYELSLGPIKPYVDLNVGYYKPDNQDGTLGWNLGIGANIFTLGPLGAEIGASYVQLPSSSGDIQFLSLGIALAIRL